MPALNHSDPLIQDAVAFSSIHHALANNISADVTFSPPESKIQNGLHVVSGRQNVLNRFVDSVLR